MPPKSIAVLGAGLSGLSSAFHLSRRFPTTKIFLLERQTRLGGWVNSQHVTLSGSILTLEGGPRTLRPAGKSILELIHLLDLQEKIVTVPKSSAAAKSRFLCIPSAKGHSGGLQKIPSSILSLVTSPLFPVLAKGILREVFTRSNRPVNAADESVDSFLSRRFGTEFARTFGSALVHGIYASDSRQLSVKASFPSLWEAEDRGKGSVVRGFIWPRTQTLPNDYELGDTSKIMRDVSVFSFRDGMQTLTQAMESFLESRPNVEILRGTKIESIVPNKDSTAFEIVHSSGMPISTSNIVSALPLPVLHEVIGANIVPHLLGNPSASVDVVNLVFECPPAEIHPEGFGYLIPRPPEGYTTDSGIGILGTVFDSCSLHSQDRLQSGNDCYYTTASHTKLTVMTGGPYPQRPLLSHAEHEGNDVPPFINQIIREVGAHLGRNLPPPVYWRVWRNEGCIPTLSPGHTERMAEMKQVLEDPEGVWKGRLEVVGAGVGGVSVPDCVDAGRRVGLGWT